ncbi:MAG TPA: tetratricopeptide repeat protein [Kofleriaceae bacterium]|nr:tetratricopeptide repeat protein [Kofleriaceae bacterium]
MAQLRDREAFEQAVVRGSELLKQGKIDLAQGAFREALAVEPDNPRVLALLGLSHFRANAFGDARAIYEQLVERAPSDASHRLNLGLVYLKLNDAERAIAALETSRALDPSQGRAVSYLGLAYARAGRYAEAYRAFLIAGQNDLATEIESNLSVIERDRIHSQLGRSPQGPLPDPVSGPTSTASGTVSAAAPARASGPIPATVSGTIPATASGPVHAAVPVPASGPVQAAASGPVVPRTITPRTVARTTPAAGVPRAPIEPEAARTPTPHVIPRTRPPGAPPAKPRAPSHPGIAEIAPPVATSPAAAPPAGEPSGASAGAVPVAVEPDGPAVARTVTPGGTVRITESTQFVIPRADPIAPVQGLDGPSMITHAVASATPSGVIRLRTRTGGTPPRPLSDLATDDLIRPDDGDEPFEIGPNGALIIRVADRVLSRLDGVHITGGDLAYELATRRSRGHSTEQAFDYGGSQLHAVTGRGYLIAVPGKHAFAAVSLDDDILYLREDLVFAFEASLRWENGNVPGLRGRLPVVQFRGDGAVALRLARSLVRVKLPAQGVVFIDAERLAGWIGRVIPRAVIPPPGGPLGAMCVECTGEGVVLIEPAPDEPAPPRAEPPARPAAPPHAAAPAAAATFDPRDEL